MLDYNSMNSKNNKICIIIPARGSSMTIGKCLHSLLNLDYLNFEIIVVDDGLDESSLESLNEFRNRVKVLNSHSRGPSYARNLAARNTDADFLAFTDSDCIVDKNWLGELLKGFKEYPEAAACGGIQKLPEDATEFERKVFLFMRKAGFITDYMRKAKGNNIIEVNHNPSCNVMYKRDIFLREGGFLEGLWPGEDVEFDYHLRKKGYKIVFNPKGVVYHYRPRELRAFLRMMYRYGWAQGFLVRKCGFFRKIQFLPLMSLCIPALFLFSLFSGFLFHFLAFTLILLFSLFIYFNFNLFIFFIIFPGFLSWHLGFFKGLFLR
jgi:cellulose synthase/poly-beta-1,6-N-acetylglucosamine synthase-like glycosyltransferase